MFFSEFSPFLWQNLRVGFPWGTLLPCLSWFSNMEDHCLWILQIWDEKVDISCYPGPMAPMLVWLAWYEFMMILWWIRFSVPRMAKIGCSIFCPISGLVFSFLQTWLYFPLASWRQPLWLPPSMKVVPQFCPVARNFLLRALDCSVEHRSRVGAFPLFGPTPRSVLSRFITNLIGKVLCLLRRRPLTVGVSRERASKIPYGICP